MTLPVILGILGGVVVLFLALAAWAIKAAGKPGKASKGKMIGEAGGMAFIILVVGMMMIGSAMHGH